MEAACEYPENQAHLRRWYVKYVLYFGLRFEANQRHGIAVKCYFWTADGLTAHNSTVHKGRALRRRA